MSRVEFDILPVSFSSYHCCYLDSVVSRYNQRFRWSLSHLFLFGSDFLCYFTLLFSHLFARLLFVLICVTRLFMLSGSPSGVNCLFVSDLVTVQWITCHLRYTPSPEQSVSVAASPPPRPGSLLFLLNWIPAASTQEAVILY